MSPWRRMVTTPMSVFLVALSLAACHKWVPAEARPVTGSRAVTEDRIRLILDDGRRVALSAPIEVEGDSLSGWDERDRASSGWQPDRRTRVALADISEIQVSRSDPGPTAVLVAVGVVAVGAVVLLVCCALPGNTLTFSP